MTREERQALRGLLRRLRRGTYRQSGRDLLGVSVGVRKGQRGTCCWCGRPCSPRRGWHDACVVAYTVAAGRTDALRSGDYCPAHLREQRCESCGAAGDEVDHRVSLGVAHLLRQTGDRRWWRAWTVGNLRWLCHACHLAKTTLDTAERQRLAGRVPVELAALGPEHGPFRQIGFLIPPDA